MSRQPLWMPPPLTSIATGIAQAHADRPDMVTLTIGLKLRTSWFKEEVLKTTRQRITGMKFEVLENFRCDLEQISRGTADQHLIEAIVAAITGQTRNDSQKQIAIAGLRKALDHLRSSSSGVALAMAIIDATAATVDGAVDGLGLLRQYLEQWHIDHPDQRLDSTLRRAAEAKKRSKATTSPQDSDRMEEPKYTAEELRRLKLVILLRKSLNDDHVAQQQTLRAVALAELAERHHNGAAMVQRLNEATLKRCAGQVNERLIAVICAAVARRTLIGAQNDAPLLLLREELHAYFHEFRRWQRQERRAKNPGQDGQASVPFIRLIISKLATIPDNTQKTESGLAWFRAHLEQWYSQLPVKDRSAFQATFQVESTPEAALRLRYAVLLHAYLESICTLSTDVLVLSELGEAVARRLGDGVELLYGILSRCYGETCSRFKYPLSGVLRLSVFQDCAETLLGWCQLVVDYKLEQTRKRYPLPRQKKREELYCRIHPFRGKRVIHIVSIYAIWCEENAAYRAAAATEVPVGPDSGKTLGDPEPRRNRRRRHRRGVVGWRHTNVRSNRFVGKRGVRRLKKWLLPEKVVDETLEHLDVLKYPRSYDTERVEAAKQAPHPYWVSRRHQPRTVKAVRPAQFRDRSTKQPVRLIKLLPHQRYLLRTQLRELRAYATKFSEIEQLVDRFLEPAPPSFPSVEPVIFAEAETRRLPFEARVEPSETFEARMSAYKQDLNWFHDFRPSRRKPGDDYSAEELYEAETGAAIRLEQSASRLQDGELQPIWFYRTMNHHLEPKAFTLLCYERTRDGSDSDRYIFACELVGSEAEERTALMNRERNEMKEQRTFVNFPGHHFEQGEDSSLVFFAVEIGDGYQGRILREVRERQERAPIKCQKDCTFEETGAHLPGCAPEAVITTATIAAESDVNGRLDWYARLPIAIPTRPCTTDPNAVIGFHEYKGGFYFAVIDLKDKLIDLGELSVPDNVGPQTRRGRTSDNFAFEMVWAMLRQSYTDNYKAYIGVEDTEWKREKVELSADINRETFAFPRERIFEIARYKAAHEGLLMPEKVRGVAPSRDCGNCGHRAQNDTAIRWRPVIHCFHCQTLDQSHSLERITDAQGVEHLHCTQCWRIWKMEEPQFKCSRCRILQHAQYNASLVVARRALDQLAGDDQLAAESDDNDAVLE